MCQIPSTVLLKLDNREMMAPDSQPMPFGLQPHPKFKQTMDGTEPWEFEVVWMGQSGRHHEDGRI